MDCAAADPRVARLLNDYQRGFPLVRRPYAELARQLGTSEAWVRAALQQAIDDARVSRIGAVFRPGAIGVSTLAALAVPERDVTRIAALVSAQPQVNHNYEREHRYNLWFVAAAADRAALAAVLETIACQSGFAPIVLPMITDYWIDLGFDLAGKREATRPFRRPQAVGASPTPGLTAADRRVIAAIEGGLPTTSTPYAAIARAAAVSEGEVLDRLALWLRDGVVRRLGVIVRHRPLGFTANAMCVWDIPDARIDALGEALAREPGVNLCYRRRRALPQWRYNLYCMLHGRDRPTVESRLAELGSAHRLDRYPSSVLFSRRAFKQCGARYAAANAVTETA